MQDVFVGVLFVIAWFLFSYRGYERKDDVAGDVACLCALGVALFPRVGIRHGDNNLQGFEVVQRCLHWLR